ncbi:hypothetical protein CMUS01_02855 [Colletotrichum musicola]|uniref:Uncharacterized protein n=1 Tax=Colletotrichum musicola TaxID=2175873 RepID=A0A8H6NU91_9PEZI|nr:hypothetical protein CMUS01_02855 [Colletotrichum musicola]
MANSDLSGDPADDLGDLIKDALVQTGKALKSWGKDARYSPQAQVSWETKMPGLIESFHWKLDDLESEIVSCLLATITCFSASEAYTSRQIRAKAALQRDLDRIQDRKRPVQQSAPVEAQSKSPMAVDLDSSSGSGQPSPETKVEIAEVPGPHGVPVEPAAAPAMAPFPDMGISFQPPAEPAQAVKQEPAPAPPAMMAPMGDAKVDPKPQSSTTQPQLSGAPEAPMDDLFALGAGGSTGTTDGNNSEFHFTDMTFSLAPPNGDSQGQSQSQDAVMDMSFGSGDMNGGILSLDNLLPPDNTNNNTSNTNNSNNGDMGVSNNNANSNSNNAKTTPSATQTAQAAPATAAPAAAMTNQEKPTEKQESTNLDDLFNLESSAGLEGMDLDINMSGDGGDGSTFDDMYFGDMTEMEHGKFDDAFFGIQ